MLRTRSRWIAASSALLLLAAVLEAARRPRYGGELRIETPEAVASIDPAALAADPEEQALKSLLLGQVFRLAARSQIRASPPGNAVSG